MPTTILPKEPVEEEEKLPTQTNPIEVKQETNVSETKPKVQSLRNKTKKPPGKLFICIFWKFYNFKISPKH